MNAITTKLSALSVDEIADIIDRITDDMSDEAGIVLESALDVLEKKMEEADFVRFCDKL